MAALTFKNLPIATVGRFPEVGETVKDISLVASDLSEIALSDFKGKKVIFNIFPSVDTPVCAVQLQKFNQMVASHENTALLFSSLDLPFAFSRFCATQGIENAVTASDYRHRSLARDYGVEMQGGPLNGLYARAVLVLDENQRVIHSELVAEVTDEPDYDAAIAALNA